MRVRVRFAVLGVLAAGLIFVLSATAFKGVERSSANECRRGLTDPAKGRWLPDCWRPYRSTSPFNRRIPSGAAVDPQSDRLVAGLTGLGAPQPIVAGYHDTDNDWGHPIYVSRPGDPMYRLDCVDFGGDCSIDGMRLAIPRAARAAGGGDAHFTVVDPRSGWEYDLWRVVSKPSAGGRLVFGSGGRTRITGDGLRSGGTAAGYGNLAGVIRAREWRAGRIDHALFMVVRCTSSDGGGREGRRVWPAQGGGLGCEPGVEGPPMGTRFQLVMTEAEIDALDVPSWKKMLFRAMARYGMYVGDTGGGASWGLKVESDSTYTSFGRKPQLVEFARDAGWRKWFDPDYGRTVYLGDFAADIDWATRLRVIRPCVARGTC